MLVPLIQNLSPLGGGPQPTVTCPVLAGTVGIAITPIQVMAAGGAGGPYTFSEVGLPTGLVMSIAGVISGTPQVQGTFPYTIFVIDIASTVGSSVCSVSIQAPLVTPNAVTAGSIVTAILRRLDEVPEAPVFWSRAEILQILNDGFIEFTLLAGQLTSERTYDLIGAKLQATPLGAIAVMHVSYGNKKIEKSSIELIDRDNPAWDGQSGLLRKWAPCGLDRWFVDRHPVSAGTSVTLVTLDDPGDFTESTVIDLSSEYIDALTEYGFHFARFKESGGELQQSMANYDAFLSKAGHQAQRTFSQQFNIFSRDPHSESGTDYATTDRS